MNIWVNIMNYGMVKRMYDISDKFLYEILDDYKDTVLEKEKENIINAFMKLIWSSKNKRSVSQKSLKFSVYKTQLETDIGKIFKSSGFNTNVS